MTVRAKKFLSDNVLDFYFCFWSRYYLGRWRPKIVVVTGTVGKTHVLDLLKYQMGDAVYHTAQANTKIGITCQLLGLKSAAAGYRYRWLTLLFLVPLKALFKKCHLQKIYLVEYDVANVFATRFFQWWLRPHICLWVSINPAHLQFFERTAAQHKTTPFAVAVEEFSLLVKSASEQIFALADSQLMRQKLSDAKTPVTWVEVPPHNYKVTLRGTEFKFPDIRYLFSQPVPLLVSRNLVLIRAVLDYFRIPVTTDLRQYAHAPSRHTVLAGIKNSHLIDSTYNNQLAAALAMLQVLHHLPVSKKWLVCGDMIEQGEWAEVAHRRLAAAIVHVKPQRVFLIGSCSQQYIDPVLRQHKIKVSSSPKIDQVFIEGFKKEMQGREVILFKGAGHLYVLVKALLHNPQDVKFLHRSKKPRAGLMGEIL